MEKKKCNIKPVIMVMMVLSLVIIGQCDATSFSDCYKGCFLKCLIIPNGSSIFSCATKCVKDCILPSSSMVSSLDYKQQTNYFCKLGCASSLCTNFSSITDPGEKKVERCVKSCSNKCTTNYLP
ncbi:thionin-like protein 2 [Mercurialis annua]|uniref:thionin-like protein 2 n=1 Tax=Mercurialis annua TaxID=3986 RepID=UPI00215F03A4|nr:thionin-like protein 2 [Mercurialis annua]XP_050231986.1 thionin-like protein 2 [Mercurialis annua]